MRYSSLSFTIEYFEPKHSIGLGEIKLKHVVHAYRPVFNVQNEQKFNNRSGTCNFNVVCPIGDRWRNQIRSVAMIMLSGGSRLCSGSMLNNHAQDGKQLFLTAAHCGTASTSWMAVFNFQTRTCPRGGPAPLNFTVSGMRPLSRNAVSDFHIAELVETIPESYNVWLNGWSAIDRADNGSIGIHHPMGDVKKITFSSIPHKNGSWSGGPPNTHWRIEPWHNGTTEPGSSGSPLYDTQHRVIGQLHGGSASCSNMNGFDVYGKIAVSWNIGTTNATRLRDHLDPKNTNVRTQQGANLNDLITRVQLSDCRKCLKSCSFFEHLAYKKTICQMNCLSFC